MVEKELILSEGALLEAALEDLQREHRVKDISGWETGFANLSRALSSFRDARPAGVTTDERGALLAFEALLIEALQDTASLLHQRGDDGGARECLELVGSLRGLVQSVIEVE